MVDKIEQNRAKILFIGKKNDFYVERAMEFVSLHFPDSEIVLGMRGDSFPDDLAWWEGDYIISYLSPWIIPAYLLNRAGKAGINFHPGPPEYPGIGCTNFAIYNNENVFGVTCHYMKPKVDTGKIIAVRRFRFFSGDSVFSLTQRCYSYILTLFYEIMSIIYDNGVLPVSEEVWRRKPYTRKELNDLCSLSADMSVDEAARRVRAVSFPGAPGAYVKIGNMKFNYDVPDKSKNS